MVITKVGVVVEEAEEEVVQCAVVVVMGEEVAAVVAVVEIENEIMVLFDKVIGVVPAVTTTTFPGVINAIDANLPDRTILECHLDLVVVAVAVAVIIVVHQGRQWIGVLDHRWVDRVDVMDLLEWVARLECVVRMVIDHQCAVVVIVHRCEDVEVVLHVVAAVVITECVVHRCTIEDQSHTERN